MNRDVLIFSLLAIGAFLMAVANQIHDGATLMVTIKTVAGCVSSWCARKCWEA